MQAEENPRERIGGNRPPLSEVLKMFAEDLNFSETIAEHLRQAYAPFIAEAVTLLEEARALPAVIPDKETRDLFPPLIKRMRDLKGKLEAFHKAEKEPFYRGGQACDQVFFGVIDKLLRRAKDARPGGADVLNARLTDYDSQVLAAEQERLRLEAEEAARVAKAAQDKAAADAKAAEDARLAAERARKPEAVQAKTEAAQEAEKQASEAKVEATVETARAEQAHVATLAKPADIMRDRQADGTMSTMAQEKYAEVEDRTKLDLAKLAPYLPLAALETALRGWAKFTDFNEPMAGARIGRRNKTRVL